MLFPQIPTYTPPKSSSVEIAPPQRHFNFVGLGGGLSTEKCSASARRAASVTPHIYQNCHIPHRSPVASVAHFARR